MAKHSGRAKGTLEREILACLAASDGPMTVSMVLAELDSGLAYTTVMTTLSRLHAKHAITRTQEGRAFAYSVAGGTEAVRASVTAFHMSRLLQGEPDRASVLSRFVAELSEADEKLLHDALRRDPRTDGSSA